MAHIVKITKVLDGWHIEDRKKRWITNCTDAELCSNSGQTDYKNDFPFPIYWHCNQAIQHGLDNYFHATWNGAYWQLHGRCHEPKHKW